MKKIHIRIHGDNIVECERTLDLISKAYDTKAEVCSESLYLPSFKLHIILNTEITVELFGGHDRWGIAINDELSKYGAPLREAADSYVTLLTGETEELLFAVEYCGALPAGNNAWQRSGRAANCAEIGIPYLYFGEIGGVELDTEREIKAPRFPNPIVPFSYLTTSKSLHVFCIPIYQAHPAISMPLREKFSPIFGFDACLNLVKILIENNTETISDVEILLEKALSLVKILADDRKNIDTFRGAEWDAFLHLDSGLQKAEWIKNQPNKQIWRKKTSDKINTTKNFKTLLAKTQALNCLSIGAKDIPVCLLVNGNIKAFSIVLQSVYHDSEIKKLASTSVDKNKPLLIVWLTGFKPRGDDSRPDRGLVPLARMLFGNDIDILSIVYGPAKKTTWKKFKEDYTQLANENGLWESILNLSNYCLADSATSEYGALCQIIERKATETHAKITMKAANAVPIFGEHDIDTAIHSIFSRKAQKQIFESLCNPPGGDWSGISYYDYETIVEFRWTSLPRVSAIQAKRPDHIIQINRESANKQEIYFLVIESKNYESDLEQNIGERLCNYVKALFSIPPTAYRKENPDKNNTEWSLYEEKESPLRQLATLSGAAYCYRNDTELQNSFEKGRVDFVLAFEFKPPGETSILHIKTVEKSRFIIDLLTAFCGQGNIGIKIKIH
ncbi:MAG: hypothetical protein LBU18_06360 [Treponema sp.]|nr:hypothetical protein [Treponema sp.]